MDTPADRALGLLAELDEVWLPKLLSPMLSAWRPEWLQQLIADGATGSIGKPAGSAAAEQPGDYTNHWEHEEEDGEVVAAVADPSRLVPVGDGVATADCTNVTGSELHTGNHTQPQYQSSSNVVMQSGRVQAVAPAPATQHASGVAVLTRQQGATTPGSKVPPGPNMTSSSSHSPTVDCLHEAVGDQAFHRQPTAASQRFAPPPPPLLPARH
jgi:hypothetical protein